MAAFVFAAHEMPARPCAEFAPTGARALMTYLLDRFDYTHSMGILSCRNVGGTNTLSKHGKGWAYDCGVPTTASGAARRDLGMPIVDLLGPNAKRLGIDELIYDRVVWRATSPNGTDYTGQHPHRDHIHIGLTEASTAQLNGATLDAVLKGRGAETIPAIVATGAIYVVQGGDSMAKIARRFGIPTQTLIAANPQITDPKLIRPGQVITLPGQGTAESSRAKAAAGGTYVVQGGDSMAKIARRFRIPTQTLIAANPQIVDPKLIHPGQVLVIP
jgi:LysM repeat protein